MFTSIAAVQQINIHRSSERVKKKIYRSSADIKKIEIYIDLVQI